VLLNLSKFLPRDDMHSADYGDARCLSVCHVSVFCETKRIITPNIYYHTFSPLGSQFQFQ